MTIKELIEALRIMDPDKTVYFYTDGISDEVEHVTDENNYILLE